MMAVVAPSTELVHFSHEQHPMTLVLLNDPFISCGGCRKPTSSDLPTYACRKCNIFLHKRCAELPEKIEHPMHSEHPLMLLAKLPYENGDYECNVCQLWMNGFVYHCSSCKFDVDILCASSISELQRELINIPTHNHPMRLLQRPASFKCNACEKEDSDQSYLCTQCGFWIHKKCGLFPENFKREDHDHPLSLAPCLPIQYRIYGFTCEVCNRELPWNFWIYYCKPCKYFVHFKCVAAKAPHEKLRVQERSMRNPAGVIHLPNKNIVQQGGNITRRSLLEKEAIQVESHKHSLLLVSDHYHDDEEEQEEITCDGCIESINNIASERYYKCGECSFFLHRACANLFTLRPPPSGFVGSPHHHMTLYFPNNIWEVVKCKECNSYCSGYSYKCEECDDYYIDLKCYTLLDAEEISHEGHKHVMQPRSDVWFLRTQYRTCNGCGGTKIGTCKFMCHGCNFILGLECAQLPPTVKHRWDKHPLILSFPPFIDITDDFYCEVCEEEIHPKRWIYRCAQCDHSFHPHCLPTLGESRNIKFGRTITIQRHPHPLTLIPEGNLISRCDSCFKSLYWQRAFECAPCRFFLCPDCIVKEPDCCNV